jgi:hypothetical protein
MFGRRTSQSLAVLYSLLPAWVTLQLSRFLRTERAKVRLNIVELERNLATIARGNEYDYSFGEWLDFPGESNVPRS